MLVIKLPGTTSNTSLPELLTTLNGFPTQGLTDLFLFEDGSGTSPENAVDGAGAGVIEDVGATNAASSWLSGGGGLRLEGTMLMSAPARDASTAWTIVQASTMAGSTGGTASERIAGVMGFRNYPTRGAALYLRGGTDWNSGTPDPTFNGRATDNGGPGGVEVLSPASGINAIGRRLLHILSYNGAGTLSAQVITGAGSVVASTIWSAAHADFLLASGTTQANQSVCCGLQSATFAAGVQDVEAFARYDRVLSSSDLAAIRAAATALGTARGRAWS